MIFLEGTNPVCIIIIIALFLILICILDVYWCSGLLIIPNTAEPVITSVIGYSTHSQQHIFRKVRSRNFIVNQSQQQEVKGRAVYFLPWKVHKAFICKSLDDGVVTMQHISAEGIASNLTAWAWGRKYNLFIEKTFLLNFLL